MDTTAKRNRLEGLARANDAAIIRAEANDWHADRAYRLRRRIAIAEALANLA